jgi:hypothetical protein
MKVTTLLRNAAQAGKPKPMSADHTQYHHMPTVGALASHYESRKLTATGLLEEVQRCCSRSVSYALTAQAQADISSEPRDLFWFANS